MNSSCRKLTCEAYVVNALYSNVNVTKKAGSSLTTLPVGTLFNSVLFGVIGQPLNLLAGCTGVNRRPVFTK